MKTWLMDHVHDTLQAWADWWNAEDGVSYDRFFFVVMLLLVCIGFVMVTSASVPVAERLFGNPLQITTKHVFFIIIGFAAAYSVLNIPIDRWHQGNMVLLAIGLIGLIAVLAVGRNVNGSTRWLVLGPINVQVAEPAKLFFFVYLSSYLVRRHDEVRENLKGFLKPLIILFAFAVLLLLQPDLGTVIVMFSTSVVLLFLAGAKLWQFFGLIFTGLAAISVLIVYSEYRWRRVTSYLDPWADPFGSGYQLTQSLMAFGRGGWSGQGLGNSVQKLEYLPEAHTDFIFAVIAEELGLLGVFLVLSLLFLLFMRALWIGKRALQKGLSFHGFLAYAIAVWIGFQTFVNIGVSTGVLPTKGLTLPFVSYGGSSLIVMLVASAIVLRIDFEVRLKGKQAIAGGGAHAN